MITTEDIKQLVAQHFKIDAEELTNKSRKGLPRIARQVAAAIMMRYSTGRLMGLIITK